LAAGVARIALVPVGNFRLTQSPAQADRPTAHLTRKVHEPDIESLYLDAELRELSDEAVDSARCRLNITLQAIDLDGVRRRAGGQHVERLHKLLPAGVLLHDVLNDAANERQGAVRLLDGEGFHVMHRVCTPHARVKCARGCARPRPAAIFFDMTPASARMTATDLTRARALLGLSPGELAAEIGLTEPVVRAWEDGSLRIPQQYAIQIVWRAAVAERQAALASSGLPECAWVTTWMDAAPPRGGAAQREHLDALRRHAAVCPHCTARARFVEQNFPPMPDLPVPPAVRALRAAGTMLKRFPGWLRAAVVGAVAVGALTIVRVAGMAIGGEGPSPLNALFLIARSIVTGAYLGAVAGITYAIVRDPLRKIGRAGDYVAGILCVWAYLLASVILMELLTGRPAFATPDEAAALAFGGAVIGALIGHFWFRRR
jgi:hypothetical protein